MLFNTTKAAQKINRVADEEKKYKRFLNSDLIRKKMANINVIKLIYALISINQNILKLVVNPKMIIGSAS